MQEQKHHDASDGQVFMVVDEEMKCLFCGVWAREGLCIFGKSS